MNEPDGSFLFAAGVMALIAVVLVAFPLLRRAAPAAGAAERESERALPSALFIILGVPIVAGFLYATWSNWPWLPVEQIRQQARAPQPPGEVVEMVSQLEQRLMSQGGTVEEWRLLGRSKLELRDYPGAAIAYQQVHSMTGDEDIQSLIDYAESLFMSNPQSLQGEGGTLIEKALALAPDNPKALWYGGLLAYQREQWPVAVGHWENLLSKVEPERDDIRRVLTERIGVAREQMGQGPVSMEPVTGTDGPAAGSGTSEHVAATTDAATKGTVAIDIVLDEAVAAQVPAGSVLFVLARTPNGGGPPLAVARRSSDELPMQLTLSDADAMLPGRTISSVEEVQIVARVALSGQPVAQSGDVFGSALFRTGQSQPVQITIDQVAP